MRKNYLSSIFVLALTLFVGFSMNSQNLIVANDDYFTVTNPTIAPPGMSPVTFNDQIDGAPINLNQVNITLINTPTSLITMDLEGSIVVNSQTPSGVYLLQYQVCLRTDPSNCATAFVTLTVNFCRTPTPIIDSVTQPTCSNPNGSVTLSGLPEAGIWMMSVMSSYGGTVFGGTGTTYTFDGLAADLTYTIHVTSGDVLAGNCFESFNVFVAMNPLETINSTMTGTYVDYNNDGFTNVGDIISYQFSLDYSLGCDNQNISVSGYSLDITGSPINLNPGGTNNAITGTYALTQNDINSGSVFKLATIVSSAFVESVSSFTPLNISDGIKLTAFLDVNSNGIKDNGEEYFTTGEFHYDINNSGTVNHAASNNGVHFLYESNPANNYNLSFTVNGEYAANYLVSPASYSNITVPSGSGITEFAFAVTSIPFVDLSVSLYNYGVPPRPGFTYQNFIQYTNHGNQTIASGTVTFVNDPLLSISNISAPGAVSSANGFTLDFVNLGPNETRYITVSMQVPTIPTVALGDLLTNSFNISIPTSDINISNNSVSYTQVIVGSYDPNDKSESHAGQVDATSFSPDDYLTYTIRFENTGTANAINVKVDDLLDAKLDENTVRTLNASHPFVLKRVNNALTWRFDGINLPPSVENDDVTGHGYVVFQVKPKSGFALGDVIPNTADIFFDFNPAIVTNTCTTEFMPLLGMDVFENNSFDCYPNPTSGILNLNFNNASIRIDSVEVLDILGNLLISKTPDYNSTTLDLSALSKGIYLAKISANGQEKTIKIIKQ